MKAKLPNNELERLQALFSYEILDSEEDELYDLITKIASNILKTPTTVILFIDKERVWLKSKLGIDGTDFPRETSFCSHAILNPNEVLVVEDTMEDDRFKDNPYVQEGLKIRYYVGMPLVTSKNEAIGTICGIDTMPRTTTSKEQTEALKNLSKLVMMQLELRKLINDVHSGICELQKNQSEPSLKYIYGELNERCDRVLHKIRSREAKKVKDM